MPGLSLKTLAGGAMHVMYPTVRYGYFADGKLNYRRFYTSSTAYQQTLYTWDAAGNLIHVNYPTSADLAFVYNGRNEMTQMTDGLGVSTYSYTPSGQLLYEDGPFANDRVTYAYNTSRLRSSLTLQQSATTSWTQTYAYDPNRRLDAMTASRVSGTAFDYKYPTISSGQLDPASSQWEELVFPGGAKIKLSFDTRARLTSTELKNSANTVLNRHSYLYNNRNERTRQTLLSGKFIDYGYDDIGQIESANASVGNDFTYQYDAGWNLDKRFVNGVLNEDMTVDDQNIITQNSSGGIALHDHKGNITRLNGAFYYYDDENQLTGVMLTPTKLYSFAYDGKRRKRKQVEFNLVGSTWTPVGETWYIYDGMTVIQERSNTNVPTVHYTRGLDLSGTPGGAGGIGGLLTRSSGYNASTGAWSTHDYYHADGSGNITMLISNSSTPTIRAQYEYDPFGRIQTQSGSLASINTQRFSSKEQIGTSPLSYYGYRFYHADAQRWMNRDPIGESGGLNLYGFVQNNSVNRFDKLGLFAPPNPNSKAIFARCVCRAAAGAEAGSATGPLGTVVVAAGAVATELVLIDAVLAIEIAQLQAENQRTSEQIEQKDREYNQYKARCNQKPPGDLANHGNDPKKLCELWRWQLQRNKDCVSLRQAFSDKWYGGPDDKHKRTIEHYEDSIKNLDEKIKRLCKPCP